MLRIFLRRSLLSRISSEMCTIWHLKWLRVFNVVLFSGKYMFAFTCGMLRCYCEYCFSLAEMKRQMRTTALISSIVCIQKKAKDCSVHVTMCLVSFVYKKCYQKKLSQTILVKFYPIESLLEAHICYCVCKKTVGIIKI